MVLKNERELNAVQFFGDLPKPCNEELLPKNVQERQSRRHLPVLYWIFSAYAMTPHSRGDFSIFRQEQQQSSSSLAVVLKIDTHTTDTNEIPFLKRGGLPKNPFGK